MADPTIAPQAPTTTVTRNPFAMLVGLIAGVLMVVGGLLLDWLSGTESKGTDAGFEIFFSTDPSGGASFFTSAGFVVLLIAVITLLGAATSRGGLVTFGGILAVLAFVLVIITFYRVEAAEIGIGDAGLGLWAILVGGVLALVAGIAGRRVSA